MRNPVALVLSVLFSASLCIAVARADAKSDVIAAAKNFGAQKSVHATITTKGGEIMQVDMVEPNKISGTGPQGVKFVMIGTNMWINMGGSWRSYAAGVQMMQTQMALARGSEFQKSILSECTVTDAGMSAANGAPARKYHAVCGSNGGASDVWIANGLPVQMVDGGTKVIWSNYNGVPNISAPM